MWLWLQIAAGTLDFNWGTLVNFRRKSNPDEPSEMLYIIEVLFVTFEINMGKLKLVVIVAPRSASNK